MAFGSDAANLAGGSPTAAAGLIIQDFRYVLRGKTVPLADQEPISCDAQDGVMVKSAPTPSFIVAQTQLLLEFLIIAFDDPAVFGDLHSQRVGVDSLSTSLYNNPGPKRSKVFPGVMKGDSRWVESVGLY